MNSKKIREKFLEFFKNKGHKIVHSSPMVNQNDPSLMFINAGMNQFKDYFLGNDTPEIPRIADTQKCLRVSGKHNDLEDVGKDSYHHTMFEMLGNWSFGDYFKADAIAWAWELLTEEYGIDENRLYATIFEGDKSDKLDRDEDAEALWAKYLPKERILLGNKKDNFWEMGDTGPCGPCSEIHIDIRPDAERAQVDGATLVNQDHPQVIEIWNLVFIEFERMENGKLKNLPQKHVDTGMGFERLCMVLQNKQSNYDTDIFVPLITFIENITEVKYTGQYKEEVQSDIAFRVMVDHIRAVSFAIADGAIPSNTGAGYVIRRILRRAVRYYYTFLNYNSPLLYKMVPLLADQMGEAFPEIKAQAEFIQNVIREEEKNFLSTLADGLKRIESLPLKRGEVLQGEVAFELYDTFGFPFDLTALIAREKGIKVDAEGFEKALEEQKNRSKKDAQKSVGDWHQIIDNPTSSFIGYDNYKVKDAKIVKYRTVKTKDGDIYQLVLNKTPFYAEGGGQVGDTGYLLVGEERIKVLDTKKENDLVIHHVDKFPIQKDGEVYGEIDLKRRKKIENNHSATHLLHAALREVLGDHVQQKGSLVAPDYLRFDFSHFQKMTTEEIEKVEKLVNQKIRENIERKEARSIPIEEAKSAGAMMLFGEKYGEEVRMITFDETYSIELCGGCHVSATGQIGYFKITQEGSVAAGIRRIEAVTAEGADRFIENHFKTLESIKDLLKNPPVLDQAVIQLMEENKKLKKELEAAANNQVDQLKDELLKKVETKGNKQLILSVVEVNDSKALKNLAYQLLDQLEHGIVALGAAINGKPQLLIAADKSLVSSEDFHAGNMIREAAKHIKGGGGGQAFFASAGGGDASGLKDAIAWIEEQIK